MRLWLAPLSLLLACDGAPRQAPSPSAEGSTKPAVADLAEPAARGPAAAKHAEPPPVAEPPPASEPPPVRSDGTIYASAELMGTRVSLNVWLPPTVTAAAAGAAMQAALDAMADVEDSMSEWRSDSELSRLSQAAGGSTVAVSDGLFEVLSRAKSIATETNGAFDPTFHGVGQLWSFAPGAQPPSRAAVAEKLPLVDYRALEIDARAKTVRLAKAGMMLGLGAIAKGYAVDRASALLTERGLAHHVVEAGGDTYAAGTKGGTPWVVGIQRPGDRGVVGVLPTTDRAVVTSGNYQRYFEHEGKRYAHILDPKTGWPIVADKSPKSVTVLAANATDADAFATAVAVLGATAGMAFVESHADLEAVVIDASDKVYISSGLEELAIPGGPLAHARDPAVATPK